MPGTDRHDILIEIEIENHLLQQIALGIYLLALPAVLYTLPDTVAGPVGAFLPIVIALVSYCLMCRARARLAAANLEVR